AQVPVLRAGQLDERRGDLDRIPPAYLGRGPRNGAFPRLDGVLLLLSVHMPPSGKAGFEIGCPVDPFRQVLDLYHEVGFGALALDLAEPRLDVLQRFRFRAVRRRTEELVEKTLGAVIELAGVQFAYGKLDKFAAGHNEGPEAVHVLFGHVNRLADSQ